MGLNTNVRYRAKMGNPFLLFLIKKTPDEILDVQAGNAGWFYQLISS